MLTIDSVESLVVLVAVNLYDQCETVSVELDFLTDQRPNLMKRYNLFLSNGLEGGLILASSEVKLKTNFPFPFSLVVIQKKKKKKKIKDELLGAYPSKARISPFLVPPATLFRQA